MKRNCRIIIYILGKHLPSHTLGLLLHAYIRSPINRNVNDNMKHEICTLCANDSMQIYILYSTARGKERLLKPLQSLDAEFFFG
jgi:hypothetical protein